MDIQDTREQRQEFESWCMQWNIAQVFPLDSDGQYDEYQIHLMYCAWLQGQAAKAQAVPELTDKMIVAIESEVESQLKASAIDADPFRLDGEKIWYAALEAQEST